MNMHKIYFTVYSAKGHFSVKLKQDIINIAKKYDVRFDPDYIFVITVSDYTEVMKCINNIMKYCPTNDLSYEFIRIDTEGQVFKQYYGDNKHKLRSVVDV